MRNSHQTFQIDTCKVTPDGHSAQMSRSGSNNQPNQGKWKNNDHQFDYTITLPLHAWELAPEQPDEEDEEDCSSSLTFTVRKGKTSCLYQLLHDAPTGASSYVLQRSDGTICTKLKGDDPQDPDVIINT